MRIQQSLEKVLAISQRQFVAVQTGGKTNLSFVLGEDLWFRRCKNSGLSVFFGYCLHQNCYFLFKCPSSLF